MNGLIYIVGLVVVVGAISFIFGHAINIAGQHSQKMRRRG